MTVGQLMAELEQAPRGATRRALVVSDDIIALAADVDHVQFAAKGHLNRGAVESARVRRRLLPLDADRESRTITSVDKSRTES